MNDVIFFPARAGNFGTVYVWQPAGAAAFSNVVISMSGRPGELTFCRSDDPVGGRHYLSYTLSRVPDGDTGIACRVLVDDENAAETAAHGDPVRSMEAELLRLKRYCEEES